MKTKSKRTGGQILGIVFYLSGEDPRFYKRRVKQYPASLSGGLQSPTETNAPRGCAGIRFGRCQLALTRIPRQFSRARIEMTIGAACGILILNLSVQR